MAVHSGVCYLCHSCHSYLPSLRKDWVGAAAAASVARVIYRIPPFGLCVTQITRREELCRRQQNTRKPGTSRDCSPDSQLPNTCYLKLARLAASAAACDRQTYSRPLCAVHGKGKMGTTISTLVFQPPPATFIHNKKHFWLQTRNQIRIPVFHVERRYECMWSCRLLLQSNFFVIIVCREGTCGSCWVLGGLPVFGTFCRIPREQGCVRVGLPLPQVACLSNNSSRGRLCSPALLLPFFV